MNKERKPSNEGFLSLRDVMIWAIAAFFLFLAALLSEIYPLLK
jgi:hypothetical protein